MTKAPFMTRLPQATSRSIQTPSPTAGIGVGAAEAAEQLVVAAAGDQRLLDAAVRIVQPEFEAGVVVEPDEEPGREADARDVDAARGEEAGAALEQVERGIRS